MKDLIETILERVFLSVISFVVCCVAVIFVGSISIAVWYITIFAFTGEFYYEGIAIAKFYAIMFVALYFPSLIYIFTRSKEAVSDFVFDMLKPKNTN